MSRISRMLSSASRASHSASMMASKSSARSRSRPRTASSSTSKSAFSSASSTWSFIASSSSATPSTIASGSSTSSRMPSHALFMSCLSCLYVSASNGLDERALSSNATLLPMPDLLALATTPPATFFTTASIVPSKIRTALSPSSPPSSVVAASPSASSSGSSQGSSWATASPHSSMAVSSSQSMSSRLAILSACSLTAVALSVAAALMAAPREAPTAARMPVNAADRCFCSARIAEACFCTWHCWTALTTSTMSRLPGTRACFASAPLGNSGCLNSSLFGFAFNINSNGFMDTPLSLVCGMPSQSLTCCCVGSKPAKPSAMVSITADTLAGLTRSTHHLGTFALAARSAAGWNVGSRPSRLFGHDATTAALALPRGVPSAATRRLTSAS
mmetsp:Transcript_40322/g.120249  ORF Transcript_40322/g.120249 Transcript_40322/m.120249 type:complete len:390 (-) Transcript_40322:367-1536(-)